MVPIFLLDTQYSHYKIGGYTSYLKLVLIPEVKSGGCFLSVFG